MKNIFDGKIKSAIAIIITIFILLTVLLGFAMFGKSYENGIIERELLVNTVSTILSGYLGIIGVLIGIWGTYYMFIIKKEDDLNSYKLYVKTELEYTLSKTAYLMSTLEFEYRRNFYKYRNNKEWCINNANNKETNGTLQEDLEVIRLQVALTGMQPDRWKKNKEDVSQKDIKEISDIYLFKKKLNELFREELTKKYNRIDFATSDLLIEKAIHIGLPINYIREWFQFISQKNKDIDVLKFIELRNSIETIKNNINI